MDKRNAFGTSALLLDYALVPREGITDIYAVSVLPFGHYYLAATRGQWCIR